MCVPPPWSYHLQFIFAPSYLFVVVSLKLFALYHQTDCAKNSRTFRNFFAARQCNSLIIGTSYLYIHTSLPTIGSQPKRYASASRDVSVYQYEWFAPCRNNRKWRKKKKKSLRNRYEQIDETRPPKKVRSVFHHIFLLFFKLCRTAEKKISSGFYYLIWLFLFFSWLVVDSSQSTKTGNWNGHADCIQPDTNFLFSIFFKS